MLRRTCRAIAAASNDSFFFWRCLPQIDNTFNKLQTLCEYIDDTEVGGGRRLLGLTAVGARTPRFLAGPPCFARTLPHSFCGLARERGCRVEQVEAVLAEVLPAHLFPVPVPVPVSVPPQLTLPNLLPNLPDRTTSTSSWTATGTR